jgi:hypothetical protein
VVWQGSAGNRCPYADQYSLLCAEFGLRRKWRYYWKHRFEIWAISFLADRRQTFTEESESGSLNTSLDCNFVKIQKRQ